MRGVAPLSPTITCKQNINLLINFCLTGENTLLKIKTKFLSTNINTFIYTKTQLCTKNKGFYLIVLFKVGTHVIKTVARLSIQNAIK